jgi:hypothetical protein
MSSKHGPNSWDDYLNVHQRRIASFADHFILGPLDLWYGIPTI